MSEESFLGSLEAPRRKREKKELTGGSGVLTGGSGGSGVLRGGSVLTGASRQDVQLTQSRGFTHKTAYTLTSSRTKTQIFQYQDESTWTKNGCK